MSIYGIATTFWFVLGAKYVLPVLFFSSNPALASAVGSVISAGMFVLVLVLYLERKRMQLVWPFGVKLVAAFVLWTLITIVYTQASSKPVALAYWSVMAFDAASAALLMRLGKTDRMADACLRGIIFGSLVIAGVTVLLLRTRNEGRWGDEELLHPNTIGNQLTLAALCSIHLMFGSQRVEHRIKMLFALSLLVVTLLGTFSKTSILGFAIASIVFLLRVRTTAMKKLTLLMLAPMAAGLAILRLGNQIEHYMSTQMSGQAFDTLTGRTLIWAESLQMILERPVLGYGYVSFRDVGPQIAQVRLVHAHNDLLNVWFSTGLIGLSIVVLIYVVTIFLLRRRRTDRFTIGTDPIPFASALLVFCLLRSVTEGNVSNIVFSLHLVCLVHVWVARAREVTGVQRTPKVRRWRPAAIETAEAG